MQKMNQSSDGNPLIKIPQGVLEGFVLRSRHRKDYFGFYGIPYGKAERFEVCQNYLSHESSLWLHTRFFHVFFIPPFEFIYKHMDIFGQTGLTSTYQHFHLHMIQELH